jgi:hypothetical protein
LKLSMAGNGCRYDADSKADGGDAFPPLEQLLPLPSQPGLGTVLEIQVPHAQLTPTPPDGALVI